MKKNSSIIYGLFLIIIGIVFLLDKFLDLNVFQMRNIWPLFVLIPGLLFEASFFMSGDNPGVLVPGGILSTIGFLFLFETYTNWRYAHITWPIYPLSVAIGLFQLFIFGKREKGLLIPVFILGTFSIIALFSNILSQDISFILLPACLIFVGILIILKGQR